jgi:hypothetical protein
MFEYLRARMRNTWIFILAASAAPISLVMSGPLCGGLCAACPAGGACLLAYPLLIGGVIVVKGVRKARGGFRRMLGKGGDDMIPVLPGRDL